MEGAIIFFVLVGLIVVGNWLNLSKLNRWTDFGSRRLVIKSHRLPFHFGLRTMLIGTTLFAMLLGLLVYIRH